MTVIYVVNTPVCECVCVCVCVCVRVYEFKRACERTRVKCYEHDSEKISLIFHLILFYILETWIYVVILFYLELPLQHQTMNLVYLLSSLYRRFN